MLNIEYLGRLSVFLLVLVALVGGCTPYATYPPMGTGEAAVPWMHPIPNVMGKALGETYRRTSDTFVSSDASVELVYGLPAGITTGVWTRVGIDTGVPGARMLTADDVASGTPVWLVEQVRIRNKRAEVDVVYPTPGDAHLRATVILEAAPFGAYEVTHFQRWQIRVDDPVYSMPVDLRSEAATDDSGSENPETSEISETPEASEASEASETPETEMEEVEVQTEG